MANKIKYGIQKAYFAKITAVAADGTPTYATPKAMPGAVSMSMSAEGENNPFYADNVIYFSSPSNNGYSGTLELALVDDEFRKDILGETVGTNSVQAEYANVVPSEFALLFQFEGDAKATRHAFYRCTVTRPDVGSQTKQRSITPVTETLNIVAMPRLNDQLVKSKAEEGATAYADWYTAVTLPSA